MKSLPEVGDDLADASPGRRGTTPRRSLGMRIGDLALNIAATAGATCILLVVLAAFFGVSIMMFKTGSMGPTIPAGSIAFVREIPATEMRVGDVVTVSRGEGVLPVTHRVVRIIESDPDTGVVTFEMRGDANDTDDPEPYTASEVRRVMFSIPGIAPVIAWFGNPYVLGGLTIAATTLVVWAFWPRRGDHRASEDAAPGRTTTRENAGPNSVARTAPSPVLSAPLSMDRHVPAVLVMAGVLLWTGQSPAVADEHVPGDHLHMESRTSSEMSALSPGSAATWTVGVWADAPDPGEITLRLDSAQRPPELRPGALRVGVMACAAQWEGHHCPTDLAVLLASTDVEVLATDVDLTNFPSDQQRWLHVTVTLGDDVTPAEAESLQLGLRVHAVGLGDHVVGVPPVPTPLPTDPSPIPTPGLPNTGI